MLLGLKLCVAFEVYSSTSLTSSWMTRVLKHGTRWEPSEEWEPFSNLWVAALSIVGKRRLSRGVPRCDAEVTAYHWSEDSEKWMCRAQLPWGFGDYRAQLGEEMEEVLLGEEVLGKVLQELQPECCKRN